MISEPTQKQLASLVVPPDKPLIICDVDEVIVHFIQDFENFIAPQGFHMEPGDPSKPYIVREIKSGKQINTPKIIELIDTFFATRTRDMKPIKGAVEGLQRFTRHANIVMLTNLPHFAGDDRRANLAALGLDFPVITNSGPKGPALSNIAKRVAGPVVFIDDSQSFIQSAYDHAPHIHLVHFLHDERYSKFVPELDYVSLRSNNWQDVSSHVLELLNA
ncbi:MAG: hypothetical protein KGO94_08305 [Alphaproteobacteria bacterium]|nr:hypothetical protein [Alphaproteobacteria bacterium]